MIKEFVRLSAPPKSGLNPSINFPCRHMNKLSSCPNSTFTAFAIHNINEYHLQCLLACNERQKMAPSWSFSSICFLIPLAIIHEYIHAT